jgi:hypothetical protein
MMWMQEILEGLQTCKLGGRDCLSDVSLLLQDEDKELLEAATILHYVGMFINHKSYHRHSHYLIKVFFLDFSSIFSSIPAKEPMAMKTGDMQIHLPEMNTGLWVSILMREMSHVNSLSKPFTIHVNAQFAGDVVLGLF